MTITRRRHKSARVCDAMVCDAARRAHLSSRLQLHLAGQRMNEVDELPRLPRRVGLPASLERKRLGHLVQELFSAPLPLCTHNVCERTKTNTHTHTHTRTHAHTHTQCLGASPNASSIFGLNATGANKHLPTDTLSPAPVAKPGATAALTYGTHHT
jgi:hypothetical protein